VADDLDGYVLELAIKYQRLATRLFRLWVLLGGLPESERGGSSE
jgi:hypothetical protein